MPKIGLNTDLTLDYPSKHSLGLGASELNYKSGLVETLLLLLLLLLLLWLSFSALVFFEKSL